MTQIEKLKTRLSTATDRPERSQRNPEQLVQGSQSRARPLRVQSEQLPTESQVFEDEVLAGAKRADDPPEEMPERHNHGKNIIGTSEFSLALSHSFCRCTTFWRDTGGHVQLPFFVSLSCRNAKKEVRTEHYQGISKSRA
jgi:hypothetical protein